MRRRRATKLAPLPEDFDAETVALVERVRPETMTSPERIAALRQAVFHIARRGIDGAVVECGVWRGGSMMTVAVTLQETAARPELYLFDTFAGMTTPTDADVDLLGRAASDRLASEPADSWVQARAGLDVVRANMASTGYPTDRVHYVAGPVEETIPDAAPDRIALLRLDTDWYESTRHELVHLWPRLSGGGVLIVDDYGHWQGARRAVDEFWASLAAPPMLVRIDYTGRLAIKGA